MADEQNNKPDEQALNSAREEGRQAAVETMKALSAAFPNDAEFAIQCFCDGLDLTASKAAYSDVLAERLQAANTEITALK